MRWTAFVLAAAAWFTVIPAARAVDTPPNLVVILLDDVGVELIGAYNHSGDEVRGPEPPEHAVTPNLDALAERGLLFRNAWSAPLCHPARAALLTGTHGFRNGSIRNNTYANRALPTLPKRLRELGYEERFVIGKWHLSDWRPYQNLPNSPTQLGFTRYAGPLEEDGYSHYSWANDPPSRALQRPGEYLTDKVFSEAVRFVRSQPAEPWLLWIATLAAHAPWREAETPRSEASACQAIRYERRRVRCRQLEIFDEGLGSLLGALEASDPGWSRTTVFVAGDNGSPDDPEMRLPGQVNRGGKRTLYEGGVNVPLIAAGAGVTSRGPDRTRESTALVHLVDVFATALDLAGAESPESRSDSRSLVPILRGGRENRHCVYADGIDFAVRGQEQPSTSHDVAIRNARYKLIRRGARWGTAHSYEFYDLSLDPSEESPLPATGSAFETLRAELERLDTEPQWSPCQSINRRRYVAYVIGLALGVGLVLWWFARPRAA
jgi:arylsulfatase A-like enzyme